MKLHLLSAAILATSSLFAQADDNFVLRTLTFEDADFKGEASVQCTNQANWSSLISDPQYGSELLYGKGGQGAPDLFYYWNDDQNTFLAHELPFNWNNYAYWGGGHAISHYVTDNFTTYGTFNFQLTIYKANAGTEIKTSGGGHNGSDNFAVHYGYRDNSGYSATNLPSIYFSDGEARIIDHMYVTNNAYAINCYLNGNGLTAKIGANDWVKIVAIGYDANGNAIANTCELYLCNGPDNIVTDWTKFDLSPLGAVTKVDFNIMGSSDNGYGFSQPAYFAYDDVAVRFPAPVVSTVDDVAATKTVASVHYFNLQGMSSDKPHAGVNIVKTVYTDGTVSTTKVVK